MMSFVIVVKWSPIQQIREEVMEPRFRLMGLTVSPLAFAKA